MQLISSLRRQLVVVAEVLGAAMLLAGTALAADPRWTTGWPYYQNNNGNPVVWYTTQPQYFTDPGDLSTYVNHAAADAMVAAAAATWNISTSSLTLAQGGALNEHVSSANVYLGSSGPVFPSDVQASSYSAKQIAIIYDSDGSVTDTLLGGGASDPGNCRQSAVTESVDSISTNGQILHALLVLNGRCTGSAAALQMEMKYRLIRAFGRILGLGWSQLNDNVFTGVPQATSQQAANWPIMHPIDVLCGPYAYQCMVQPFTLRTDDMASLISIYPVTTAGNGKTASFDNAANVIGFVSFPNGQGMEGVLVSVRRFHFGPGYTDAFDVTSGVTGASFQQTAGNLTMPKDYSQAESNGSSNQYYEGYYSLGWIPILTADYFDNFTVTTSPVNSLYTGQYAVGPYAPSQVMPSGGTLTSTATVVGRGGSAYLNMAADSAPATCPSGGDGSVYTPLAVTSSGSWSDTLCGYQHSAWSSLQVQAGRSLTVEVTATDEQGYATTGKMLPVIGVWDINDSTGALPTLASQAAPLNASTLGMTNLMVSNTTARTMRIGIADLRGDGRPDYGYNARILYADSISPASLPANGGVVTISGMGFHPGNTVTVNGIVANVTNWTATSITMVAPAITGPLAADVVVTDLSTSGQTTMSGALIYSQTASPDLLSVVSKPAGGGYVGSVGSPVFKVQVMLPDGVTPAASVAVTFSSTSATFGACSGASTCMLTTDSSGFVSSSVTPTSAGTVTLTATVGSTSVSANFNALAIPVDGLTVVSLPSGTVYATLPATAPFSVKVTLPGSTTVAAGVSVVVTATNAALGACSGASTCTLIADASGMISTAITPAAAGVVSLLATAGGGMVSASFGTTALPADVLRVVSKPADGSYVGRTATVPFALQVVLGDNATPASGVAVALTATGATFTACGASSCVVTADATGSVTTSVIPTTAGTVALTANAGGGTISTSFNSVVVPPDVLHAVSKPADGSYVGRIASVPFNVQVALGDTGAAAAGVSVNVSTTNGILNACGASTCTLTADSTGTITTTVTPTVAGTVGLMASAGGGTLSVSFLAAAIPPDTLTILTKPANGSYVGRTATLPFAVQVFSGETGAPDSAVAVTLTAANATLSACAGASSCILPADSTGTISATVTPTAVGTVSLSASAGGGTASTTFTAVAIPPDALHTVTQPTNGSYVGRVAAIPFAVQVALGDTGGPATGVSVSVSATNAVLNACGAATCTLTADSTGSISTTVTPSSVGSVNLTASAGGGSVSTTFNAVVVPPDTLHVVTQPANGSYVGRVTAIPFAIQVALGDTGGPATGVSVIVSATNGVLNTCGAATCTLTADSTGSISTTVTPSSAGSVNLTASAGGGTVSTAFNAVVVPPDTLHVVTQPANGSYVGRAAAIPLAVQVALGDTGGPAAGVSISVSATNAVLNACGAATCTLTADPTGTISTTVTPSAVGPAGLTAAAGGGTVLTTFNAIAIPPDALSVVTQPANGSYVGRTATIPFAVQVTLGDTGGPASGVSVIVSTTNAVLNACGATTCTLTANASGTISTTVTPSAVGSVTLTAAAGGGTVSTSFNAVAIPPDALNIVSQPANGSYVGRTATIPFAIQVTLGDTGGPASGISVIVSATNTVLNACGAATCTLTANAGGSISTTVTPSTAGTVGLTASAGGGTVSTTFSAVVVPPDALHVVAQPTNGSYVGRTAATSFTIQVALGDTGAAAAGVTVSISATNALLNACGATTCTLIADSTGTVSTTVIPTAAGSVGLTASAGGGTASVSFNAIAVPPDALHVVAQPADGSYIGASTTAPFTVQVALGDTGGPAANISVIVSAANATLDACGAATCTLTTDSTGTISTTVTPTAVGTVTLFAGAGGGSVSASFLAAVIPPDTLNIITRPADGAYIGRVAALPFSVQILDGKTGAPASGASVTVTATGATLASCGDTPSCVLTADSTGTISTTLTPSLVGIVSLSASVNGGAAGVFFNAIAVPPDTLTIVTQPVSGSYVGRPAAIPFSVQVALGDTGAQASGVSVIVSATNAVLNACGASTCTVTADSTGTISTTVTPSAVGSVSLSASAGGGIVSTTFNAVAVPPDALHVVTQPTSGSYVGHTAATPFSVQIALGDTGAPAAGVSVIVSATNATLTACGASICTLIADSTGTISTTVTPSAVGSVSLSASAGGGTVSTSFNAVAIPPDTLHVVTQPANGSYVGRAATTPFSAEVALGDTGLPAAGVSVTVTATNSTLNACGASTCILTADSTGTISTTVTPFAVGLVSLTSTAGGGTVIASFTAVVVPPDSLTIISKPADGSYAGRAAAIPFTVQVVLGDTGAPAAGVSVNVSAINAAFAACPVSSCTLTADATGTISTIITPTAAGVVSLSASAGGGTLSTTFNAVAVPPDTLHVVTQPAAGSYVGRAATLPFSVQVALGDTGSPAGGASVTISATNAIFTACAASTCTLTTDSTGTITSTVTPSAVGSVGLTASAGGGTVSASFNAVVVPPDTLHVLTQPANGSYIGVPATIFFSIQALLGDTNGPANGASVTLTATNATLGCGASTCTLLASATGGVSTAVTPTSVGAVSLSASVGGGTVSTSFTAAAMPPDSLQVVTAPADNTYVGSPAAIPFSVSVLLGDGVTPASGASVTVTATGATFGVCGLSTCVVTANTLGTVSLAVTATTAGAVTLTASAGGGTVSATFVAISSPDTLQVISAPSDHSFTNQVAATPFVVKATLGVTSNARFHALTAIPGSPDAGQTITLTAVGGRLNACGLPICVLTTDSNGTVSTTVTPLLPGPVALLAVGAGGTISLSFAADTPPDTLHVTSIPANGAYANRIASAPFAVQVLLGDGVTPATGVSVTLTAANATLGSCGLATCIVVADASGSVSTSVTPSAVGSVQLTASAGGGTTTASFTSAPVPPDTLHVTGQPANGSYVGRAASVPFTVQTLLGDTNGPAAGASVTVTAVNATLGSCGLSTCVLTADSTGAISTTVTPTAAGTVQLAASAGGGTTTASFNAIGVPPDTLQITSHPANGSYVARIAASPFTVQVLLGDTGGPAIGVSVALTATNATLGACGASTCTLTTDSTGAVTTTIIPSAVGLVTLNGAAGGGTASTTFTAAAVPPDSLQVTSHPTNGSYTGRVASAPFAVQVSLGDTSGLATGAPVTLSAINATLSACGSPSCTLTADATGTVSTTLTPTTTGLVTLTATAGGGTISTSFTSAAIPPDSLQVVSHPADGSYAGSAATIRFGVQALLGDTGAPAAGASITVTASNATFGACNASTCVLTADSTGTISTTVTPVAAGTVSLTATAGGGTIFSSFTVAAAPVDTLRIISQPTAPVYATLPAATSFTVQVMLPNGTTPASGASVTLSATHATLGSCGGAASCVLTADASGTVSTTVTPQQPGVVTLQATAGGGTVSTTFTATTLPANILNIVSAPSGSVYVGTVAASRFAVRVLLGDGTTPASAAPVTLTASGATYGSCTSTCILTTDASGNISTTVTPTTSGTVTLTASSGGGTASSTFTVTPDILRIISSPANNSYTGSPATSPFAVQVLLGDGTTPVSSATVTATISGATLGACVLTPCTLTADGQGIISTPVTATTPGSVTLTASAAGGTVSTSYTAVAPPDTLQVLSSPANGSYVGRASAIPFTVQVSLGTATNRIANASATQNTALPTLSGVTVTLSASGATLDACGLASCTLTTGTLGTVSTTVTPTTAGPVTLSATAAGGTTSSSFTAAALPDVLRVASVPANGTYFGRAASAPFTVQVFQGDGITPASGVAVTLTASGAALGACGQPTCTLSSDPTGMVSTTVTPSAAGTVNLTATAGGGTASASFTVATPPDMVQITAIPANGSYTGRAASQPFTVKVLSGDGVTPAAGASVTLTASNALFGACGLPTCTSTADVTGTVSTTVIPAVAGPTTLTASAAGGTASSSFTAIDPVRTITISRTTEYVATGSTVSWTPTVTLLENGLPVSGIPVTWSSQSGLTLASSNSITNISGVASIGITIGPLASGVTPAGTACAWTTVCATFGAQAVEASAWRLVTVSGDVQTASPTDTLQPLTIRAVDDAGDWIAGVTIQVNQLVRGWVACPSIGRCPIGPVLSSSSSTLVSDVDGLATITPLQVQNTPETTGIVAAAGPNGYIAASLSKVP